jgi:hypothetical protein
VTVNVEPLIAEIVPTANPPFPDGVNPPPPDPVG